MEQELYTMRLHETIYDPKNESLKIIRVPGGWIYVYYHNVVTPVFVPYHSEFKKVEK